MPEPSPHPQPELVNCPHCGAGIEAVRTYQPQVLTCPQCSQAFILPAIDGSTLAVAEVPGAPQPFVICDDSPPQQSRHDELDGLRIRQIAQSRRAAYRSRSYFIVGTLGFAGAAGQCVWSAVAEIRHFGWSIEPILYLVGAVALLILAMFLFLRAQQLKREAERPLIEPPTRPPDFSSLSDGSQRWKDIENIR